MLMGSKLRWRGTEDESEERVVEDLITKEAVRVYERARKWMELQNTQD